MRRIELQLKSHPSWSDGFVVHGRGRGCLFCKEFMNCYFRSSFLYSRLCPVSCCLVLSPSYFRRSKPIVKTKVDNSASCRPLARSALLMRFLFFETPSVSTSTQSSQAK